MPWRTNVLVLANVTGSSPALRETLLARAARSPAVFTLIVPATGGGSAGRERAACRLEHALAGLRAVGLEVEGQVGDADPILAVHDVFDARRFDEMIVSTLAPGISSWLQADLPHRVARLTALPVTHVVAQLPGPPPPTVTPREPEHDQLLTPLKVLTWGAKQGA